MKVATQITTRALSASLWPDVVRLFGRDEEAWCRFRCAEDGEAWAGANARVRLQRGIERGAVTGVLAYAAGSPVGWCSYGSRLALLAGAPSSPPGFYVKTGFCEREVERALLVASLRALRASGGEAARSYPLRLPGSCRLVPACSRDRAEPARVGAEPWRLGTAPLRLVAGAQENF